MSLVHSPAQLSLPKGSHSRQTGELPGGLKDRMGRTYLDRLTSLLRVSQQLDGERPRVLHHVLEVEEVVAAMPAQRALPTDGHGAGVTVQVQHLAIREDTETRVRGMWGARLAAAWIPAPFQHG